MAPKAQQSLSEEQHRHIAETLYNEHIRFNDTTTDFEILSTIRYDPKFSEIPPLDSSYISEQNFFLLKEHYSRLEYTWKFFLNGNTIDLSYELLLEKLIEVFRQAKVDLSLPYKVRVLVSLTGEITIELHDTPIIANLYEGLDATLDFLQSQNLWNIYMDDEDILISPFTSFKTTNRSHYTKARERRLPKKTHQEEVLLWNTQRNIMEGSITNIAIKTDGVWLTPELSCGCLCGVMRHHLLIKGYIKEGVIPKHKLSVGDEILLFNAIMGVVRGIIREIP